MARYRRDRSVLGVAAALALGGCAVSLADSANVVDGTVCPDPRRPLPFPIVRPDCWSDAEWERYLEREAARAGDAEVRYRDQF